MSRQLRVLIVEDSQDDADLVLRILRRGGFDPIYERVDTLKAMESVLDNSSWELVIADYVMPQFSGPDALKLLQERGLDLPFIMVSDKIGEESAVEMMKAGAQDYLMKFNLKRLVPAVERELREAAERAERKQLEEKSKEMDEYYRALFENIPTGICFTDADGGITAYNRTFIDLVGYTRSEMIKIREMANLFFDPCLWYKIIIDAQEKDLLNRLQVKLKRKDGIAYDALLSLIPVWIRGRPCWQVMVEENIAHQ